MILILGAGLAGLSASYHLGHEHCLILEKNHYPFGHIHSEFINGFTWDEGPHVSFTKHDYVKELFAASVEDEYDEYEVKTGNYFQGYWIDHPAQSNLYQIPEPLRGECLQSFLNTRQAINPDRAPMNYAEWLEWALGPVFAENFPAAYTRKYWTTEPKNLTTGWVGSRVFYPSVEDVVAGSKGPLSRQTHYITQVRYPRQGGYQAFGRLLAKDARVQLNRVVERIDLVAQKVWCDTGESFDYTQLISTLPLPVFVRCCQQATPEVLEAAVALCCSQLLLVNVEAPHPARRSENWLYVYDEDKYSTRIHFTEKLTPGNAPEGWSGIQVEVYFSRYKPLPITKEEVAERVIDELFEMGLLDSGLDRKAVRYPVKWLDWANVIFDHSTKAALDTIFTWLAGYGLQREENDLEPITNWDIRNESGIGDVVLVGRFGQWKYFWSDDCVLRLKDKNL